MQGAVDVERALVSTVVVLEWKKVALVDGQVEMVAGFVSAVGYLQNCTFLGKDNVKLCCKLSVEFRRWLRI